MFTQYRFCLLLTCLAVSSAIGQQTGPAAPATTPRQRLPSPGFAAQALTPSSNADTAAVMALQMKIEDATVRGDVAYLDSVTSQDFTMVDGDHWEMGGRAQLADNKAGYLKRVSSQPYLVQDIDPTSIRFEMHNDIAICYGRYLSVVRPQPGTKNPGSISSIWFQRVFQKRNGQWIYLSHRTIHGPTPSPAGIDPTAVPWDDNRGNAKTPLTVENGIVVSSSDVPADKDPTISKSPEAAEVMAFQDLYQAAVLRGDTATVSDELADDFVMTHGDIWNRGGKAILVDNKQSFLQRVTTKQYVAGGYDSVRVEMHGNVAIVYGQLVAQNAPGITAQPWFSAWFERVFEKQNGKWIYLSHRTVHGVTFGPTRESIKDK